MRLRVRQLLSVLMLVMLFPFSLYADNASPVATAEEAVTINASPSPVPQEQNSPAPAPAQAPEEKPVQIVEPAPAAESVQVPPAAPAVQPPAVSSPPQPNLFVEHFFLKPDLKLKNKTWETQGFVFVETPDRASNTRYSMVTDFADNTIRGRYLSGLEKAEDVRKWVKDNLKSAIFEGVEVKRLPLSTHPGEQKFGYWTGQKSFDSSDQARAEIAMVKAVAEKQGRDFNAMVLEASKYISQPEQETPLEIKTPAQFEKEEEIMLKFLDHLDVGNQILGSLQGESAGEPIIWQSFGETSWRKTNIASRNYNSQVGYWTNRVVAKGIRAPLNTIDPFVEETAAMESTGVDAASHLDLSAGLEWRPLARNPWLVNFRPWTLPLLEFIRNYRFYVQYFDRKNLKDPVTGSRDTDLAAGVQMYYEWGVDLPAAAEGEPFTVPDYIRRYVWGEYFGNYRFEKTNFSSEKVFNAFLFNSSVILGWIMPGIPLPPNLINDELVFMPYFRFEHTNNTEFSFYYQNQFFVAAGVRWMPFRNYRYKENEWLSKTKVFMEYVGVGRVQFTKQDQDPANVPDYDWRIGVSLSQRRF